MSARRRPAPWLAVILAFFGCGKAPKPATGPPPSQAKTVTKPPAEISADLFAQASQAAESGNLASADLLLDQVLAATPTDRKALWLAVQVVRGQSDATPKPFNLPLYLKAASTFRKLRAAYPQLNQEEAVALPTVLYNEACALALSGDGPRAIRSLAEAFEAGFENVERVEDDTDLDPIRPLPQFQGLFDRFERAYARLTFDRQRSQGFACDFRLPNPEGKPVALSEVSGKVTVLAVWGTWCGPGRKVVANLATLQRLRQKDGLAVVGLNYESEVGQPASFLVRDFAKSAQIPFPLLIGDETFLKKIPRFSGYPTLLFLDASGQVRARAEGYLGLTAINALVQILLDELKPAAPPK